MLKSLLPFLLVLAAPSLAFAQEVPAVPNVVHAPLPDAPPPTVEAAPEPVPEPVPAPPVRLGDYYAQRLQIQPVWAFGPSNGPHVRVGWGFGGYRPHGAWHVGVGVPVVSPGLNPSQPWAVYQEQRRLTVPEYLNTVGDTARYGSLTHDLRQARTWSNVWLATAGAGAVTVVAGFVSAAAATNPIDYNTAVNVSSLGGLALLGGLVGRSLSLGHAYELENDYKSTLSLPDVQSGVDAYNDGLRQQMGLLPRDVKDEPPRRR